LTLFYLHIVYFLVLQDGWTALHWAAYKGHVAVLKCLLEAGADTTIKKNVTIPVYCPMWCEIVFTTNFFHLSIPTVTFVTSYLRNWITFTFIERQHGGVDRHQPRV